jgi:hypothetical protein
MLPFLRFVSCFALTSLSVFGCTVTNTKVRLAAAGGAISVNTPACTTVSEAVSWLTAGVSNGVVTITAVSNNAAGPRYGKVRVNNQTDILVTQFGTSAPVAVASVVGTPRNVPVVPATGASNPFRVAHHLAPLMISLSPLTLPLNATATIIANSDGYFANDVVPPGTTTFPVSNYPAVMTVDGSSQTFTATLTERNELRWLNVPIGALQQTATGGTLRLRFPRIRATGTRISFDLETTAAFTLSNPDVLLTGAVVQNPGITFTKSQPVFFSDASTGQGYRITVTVAETVATAFAAAQGNVPGTRFNVIGNLQGFGYTTYAQIQPTNARLISANNRGGGGSDEPATKTFLGISYAENDDSITYEVRSANDTALESFTFNIVVQGTDQQTAQSVREALRFPLSPLLLFGQDPCGTIPLSGKPSNQRSACGSQGGELAVQITDVAIVGSNRRITYTVTNTKDESAQGPSTPVVVRGNAGFGYEFASCTRSDGGACSVNGDTHQASISDLEPGSTTAFTVEIAESTGAPDGTLVENVFLAESQIDEEQNRTNNQASDTFVQQACSPLTPANPTYGAAGGSFTVSVPNCYIWTATSSVPWITITSPAPGVETFDPGTVSYTVQANTTASQRSGSLVIGGNTYTVTQRPPCSFTVGPPSLRDVGNGASATSFSLTTGGTNCAWTATASESWITSVVPSTSTNSQVVTVNFGANSTLAQRTATVTFRETGLTGGPSGVATIRQAAGNPCSLSVSTANSSIGSGGGTGTLNVTATGIGCSWTLSEGATWLSLGATTGSASANVTFTAVANTGAARSVTVNLLRQGVTNPVDSVTLTQAAPPPCTLGLTSPNTNIAAGGGTGTLNISATGSGCSWTLSENATWLSLGTTTGSTSTGVTFTAVANTGAARSVTVNLLQQGVTNPVASVTLSQAAVPPPCTLGLTSPNTNIGAGGGTGTLNVTATGSGCTWVLSENATWLSLSSASGTTTTAVTYSALQNSGAPRSVTVSLLPSAGAQPVASVTINQAGTICVTGLAQVANPVSVDGRKGTLNVTAPVGCAWNASEDRPWLEVFPPSGIGSATITYRVYPNFGSQARTGVINVGGVTTDVNQSASTESVERRFVRLLYFSYLGRTASNAEVDAWVATGASRRVLAASFLRAPEFNLAGRFVAGLYVGILNRDPEFSGWVFQRDAISQGTGLQCALASNFVNSAEFALQHPSLTNEGFVQLLYRQILGREAAPSEIPIHLPTLAAQGRGQLACNFLNASEFLQRNEARLTAFLFYATLLLRDSTEQERADLKNALIANPGSLESLLEIFANSAEMNLLLE